jgi:2-polyprenyl-3-methyl-5-hydroxy-6-metoxy-1,4-benzoquinol methylase
LTDSEYHGHARPEILAHFPRHSRRVLDIGCGEGALSLGMPGRSELEVWGIEMDGTAAELARERLDRVLTTDATTAVASLPDDYFDCIFCNDILEHLVEPESLLQMLRPKFARGGILISSVPNVRHFWTVYDLVVRGRWDYVDEGILDRKHLRFYTQATMREMFEDCGYEIAHAEGINPTGSLKFKLFNALTFGRFSEMRYLQYLWVLHPKTGV